MQGGLLSNKEGKFHKRLKNNKEQGAKRPCHSGQQNIKFWFSAKQRNTDIII